MRQKELLLTTILLLTLIISACSANITGKTVHNKELRVGVLLPLSGSDAAFGNNIRKGITLVESSRNIHFFIEDNGASQTSTVNAAKKLILESNIDVILITWDSDTLAVNSIPEGKSMPIVCIGCGGADITHNNPRLFSIWPSDEFEVKAVVDYFDDEGKAGVLQTINTWENALTRHFVNEWQGEVVVKKAQRGDKDMKTQLLSLKKEDIDMLYLPFYEQQYPVLLKQIRELGFDIPVATTSWINDPEILNNCGTHCQGIIVPQYKQSDPLFQKQFNAKYAKEPGLGSDVGFDAYLLMHCLVGKKDLLTSLQECEFAGASGEISFDETGKRKEKEVEMFVIRNERLERIK